MVDGAASLFGMLWGMRAMGLYDDGARGTNLLDTGAWFYEVYETADGRYVSVGAIDPSARAELLERMGATDVDDKASFADLVRTRTRDDWTALLEGTDACFAPVLEPGEAPEHPHLQERGTFTEVGGVVQPAPAPRFRGTDLAIAGPPPAPGQHTAVALADWGFNGDEVEALVGSGAVCLRPAEPL